MQQVIIAIVGASGSGKTTLSMLLQDKYKIPALCSYTTRPMRDGEVNGKDHWFVGTDHPIPQQPLAYTFFGGNHYWTTLEQVRGPIVSYVVDERGLLELKEKWGQRFIIMAYKVVRPDNPTDPARVARDKERIELPEDTYTLTIHNDAGIEKLDLYADAIFTYAQFNAIWQ